MKSFNLFSKIFIGSILFGLFYFFHFAGYSMKKVHETDPEVTKKISARYNIIIDGVSVTPGSEGSKDNAFDRWVLDAPSEKISIKTVGGNIQIKKTLGKQVVISASGKLDKAKAPRLLEVDSNPSTLTIKEPKDDATRGLQIQIEIPESFSQELFVVTVNGDLSVENLKLDSIEYATVSGDASLLNSSCKVLKHHSVSGDITAEQTNAKKFTSETISGDVTIENKMAANIKIVSVSGEVKLTLAEGPKTQFTLKSISGEINNSLGSNAKGEYEVNVSMTSGDIQIE